MPTADGSNNAAGSPERMAKRGNSPDMAKWLARWKD
jgi:hypothetical protein